MQKTFSSCLGVFIHVVVLDLAEVPVIGVKDPDEIFSVSVIGKSDVSDLAGGFLLGNPVLYSDVFQLVPLVHGCHVMHEIVVHMICAKATQLLIEVSVQSSSAAYQVLGKLGGDVYLVSDAVTL